MIIKAEAKSIVYILTWNIFFIQCIHSHILRLPCLTYGNFSIVKSESRLTSNVLETFNDLSEDECEDKCLNHRLCKSINTKNSNGVNCELNSKSTEDPFDDVKSTESTGWTYKTTDYNARNIGHHCLKMKPCPAGLTCTDSCSCPGYQCHVTQLGPSSNCQEYQNKGYKTTSVLPIQVPGMPVFDVRCDMETDGGGWIVFQRRVDASVNFYRNWNEYKAGFGDLNGNFWLGLEKIHKLAGPGKRATLRVDLKHMSMPTVMKYAEYSKFEIFDEAVGYKLEVGGYSGDAGDSLSYHNGMKFTTKDRDNDLYGINCAVHRGSAWWYNDCHYSDLNGDFTHAVSWYHLARLYNGITFSEMKIRYSDA